MAEEKDEGQERTEQATPKRREEAREKGRSAKSREITSVAILFAALIYFYFGTQGLLEKLMAILGSLFHSSGRTLISMDTIYPFSIALMLKTFLILAPVLAILFLVSISANLVQVGFLYSPTALGPDLSKIDPIKGFKRLFSLTSLVELVKSIFKMLIIGLVPYLIIKGEVANFFLLSEQTVSQIMIYLGKITFKILFSTGLVLLVLAILDYAYQRWEYEKGLRMTKQEIKDELKNTEGDPTTKARIRRLQREIARKRMMAAVPKADVVVTNPTHLAVALKYDRDVDIAPRVVAKGAGYIAEKIKSIAQENGLPLVENKSLAQLLYKIVNIGDLIPENLYRAVAEILAYVYSLKGKYAGG